MNDGKMPLPRHFSLRDFASWASRGMIGMIGLGVSETAIPASHRDAFTNRTFSFNLRRSPLSDFKILTDIRAAFASGKGNGVLPTNIRLFARIFSRRFPSPKIAPP